MAAAHGAPGGATFHHVHRQDDHLLHQGDDVSDDIRDDVPSIGRCPTIVLMPTTARWSSWLQPSLVSYWSHAAV